MNAIFVPGYFLAKLLVYLWEKAFEFGFRG